MSGSPDMQEDPELPQLPPGIAAAFYAVLALAGVGLALWLCPSGQVWTWGESLRPLWQRAGVGVGLGLLLVVLSQLLSGRFAWARRLDDELGKVFRGATPTDALILATSSALGEELFFRGFLQRILSERLFDGLPGGVGLGIVASSVIFGLLHTGPDREVFLPWTIMSTIVGVVFGAVFVWTGDLLAPVLIHFTINFLNILEMAERQRGA